MKEGWEYKTLGEVCNVIGGGTPDTKNKEYWSGNIPWATVSDMNCDVIKTTGYYITDRGLNESSSRIIKKGEVVIATRVGLGKVCKLAVDTAINQDLKGVIPKDNNIVRDFIFYYFKHKAKYIVDNGIGATVKGVKIKFIEGLSFGFPSLSEQQSIVDFLDSAFAKIDAMKANAEKALNEAKALFQASLKEMLEPKEGWEYKKLDDICTIVGRIGFRGYTKADLVDSPNDGAITLSPSNITNGELDFSKCTYISWDKYNESPEIMLTKGDVVLVKTASIGKCAVVKELPHKATLNPQFVVLKGIIGEPNFIGYYLKSPVAQITIKQMAGGVAIPTLSQKKLGTMLIPSPPLSEQQSIVATLDSLKSKVDRLQASYDKISQECDALKQAILRQVFE